MTWPTPPAADLARHWTLDPGIDFLNHGSFGACPRAVLEQQGALRSELERQPVHFFVRTLAPRLEAALECLATFVGCDAQDLAFVNNATTGVNAVLRSLHLQPGDALLTTTHVYNACRNTLEFVARRTGAHVVYADVPYPCDDAQAMVHAVTSAITQATCLVLLDHVASPTGVIFPIAPLVQACRARGVETLVDGAHAPGMLPLDLRALDATYYTGNCHKWLCAPKGAAFLYVNRARRDATWPTVISHGYNVALSRKSRFRELFDWVGTCDPTAWLSVPHALDFMAHVIPGGWPAVYAHNHTMVVAARESLMHMWGTLPAAPADMLGSLATTFLPGDIPVPPAAPAPDPMYEALRAQRFEVQMGVWQKRRYLRLAAQIYNTQAQYERLGQAVMDYARSL